MATFLDRLRALDSKRDKLFPALKAVRTSNDPYMIPGGAEMRRTTLGFDTLRRDASLVLTAYSYRRSPTGPGYLLAPLNAAKQAAKNMAALDANVLWFVTMGDSVWEDADGRFEVRVGLLPLWGDWCDGDMRAGRKVPGRVGLVVVKPGGRSLLRWVTDGDVFWHLRLKGVFASVVLGNRNSVPLGWRAGEVQRERLEVVVEWVLLWWDRLAVFSRGLSTERKVRTLAEACLDIGWDVEVPGREPGFDFSGRTVDWDRVAAWGAAASKSGWIDVGETEDEDEEEDDDDVDMVSSSPETSGRRRATSRRGRPTSRRGRPTSRRARAPSNTRHVQVTTEKTQGEKPKFLLKIAFDRAYLPIRW